MSYKSEIESGGDGQDAVVIYHSPECDTSRNALNLIQNSVANYRVVENLKEGWTRSQLTALLAAANLTPRFALRETNSPASDLGLLGDGVSDEVIFDAMLKHPVLVNRPIVVSLKGVRLCRPSETVLDLLDQRTDAPIAREDG